MPKSSVSDAHSEQLNELVRKHPILYDPTWPEHRDGQMIHNIWESIAKIMTKQHNMAGTEWKKKWRNLRDTYVKKRREIKTNKSGQGAERAQKWKFYPILNFLDAYVEESSTETNVQPPALDEIERHPEESDEYSEDEENGHSTTSSKVTRGIDVAQIHGPSTASGSSSGTRCSPPIPVNTTSPNKSSGRKKRKQEETSDMEQALTNMINESTQTSQSIHQQLNEEKTAEQLFFESCAIRIKKLTPTTRSFIQLQISQLFLNAENQHIPPVPITPLPVQQHQGYYGSAPSNSQPQTHPGYRQTQALQPMHTINEGCGDIVSQALRLTHNM